MPQITVTHDNLTITVDYADEAAAKRGMSDIFADILRRAGCPPEAAPVEPVEYELPPRLSKDVRARFAAPADVPISDAEHDDDASAPRIYMSDVRPEDFEAMQDAYFAKADDGHSEDGPTAEELTDCCEDEYARPAEAAPPKAEKVTILPPSPCLDKRSIDALARDILHPGERPPSPPPDELPDLSGKSGAEINRLAREHGMSYGKFVSACDMAAERRKAARAAAEERRKHSRCAAKEVKKPASGRLPESDHRAAAVNALLDAAVKNPKKYAASVRRLKLYLQGASINEIAAAEGVSPTTIHGWIARHGLPLKKKKTGPKPVRKDENK